MQKFFDKLNEADIKKMPEIEIQTANEFLKFCTGCGHLSNKPLVLNEQGEPCFACCPENNYVPVTQSLTLEEWMQTEFIKLCARRFVTLLQVIEEPCLIYKARQEHKKNNLPIVCSTENTWVYYDNKNIYIKPYNLKWKK